MHGETSIDPAEHLWRADLPGGADADQIFRFTLNGRQVIVYAYVHPHTPQVFVYDDPVLAERQWRLGVEALGHDQLYATDAPGTAGWQTTILPTSADATAELADVRELRDDADGDPAGTVVG